MQDQKSYSVGSVQPVEDYEAFEAFEHNLMCHKYSSCVGWVVKQRVIFLQEGKQFVDAMKEKLCEALHWKVRNMNGWAVCLFFVHQVSII